MKTKRSNQLIYTLLMILATIRLARADEGMWLFNDLPMGYLQEKHGFEPDDRWA